MVITVIHATKGCDLDESASTFTTALPAANFKSKITCIDMLHWLQHTQWMVGLLWT